MTDADGLYLDILARLEGGEEPLCLRDDLARLTEQDGESQRVAVLRAHVAERQGQPGEAVDLLERYIASRADNGIARANLARLQWKSGERVRALGTLRFALMQAPNQERSLHLYAAWLEQQTGIESALDALELLAQAPGAWKPAWVAAQLAESRAPARIGPALELAASQARQPFPPSAERLLQLLEASPEDGRTALVANLRPFCDLSARALLDQLLEAPRPEPGLSESRIQVAILRRSVWRHLNSGIEAPWLGVAPICLIKPEAWGVAEVAGRLSRGLALLLVEALDALAAGPAAVLLETVPEAGLVSRGAPTSGEKLAAQNAGRCAHLISAYLSFREPGEFILDAELYDGGGGYQNRASHRGSDPGVCLDGLARQLASASAPAPGASPPYPSLGVEEALARDAAASFVLCGEGALARSTLRNPDLLLETLVEHALRASTADALLCLWAAVEASARAGWPGGEKQRAMIAEVMTAHPQLQRWTRPSDQPEKS